MKKLISIFIILILLLSSVPVFAAQNITVIVNGTVVQFDQPPVIINSRTYVPLRAVGEILDANVKWNDKTKTVTISRGNKIIALMIGSYKMTIGDIVDASNDITIDLDVCPIIINNRTMLPIRVIIEEFGGIVTWDDSTKTVIITDDYKKHSKYNLYYDNYPTVPDFGKITGCPLVDNEYGNFMIYDISNVTSDQYDKYMTALNINGYGYDENLSESLSDYMSKEFGTLVEVAGFFKGNTAVLIMWRMDVSDFLMIGIESDYKGLLTDMESIDIDVNVQPIEYNKAIKLENGLVFTLYNMYPWNGYFAVDLSVSISDSWIDNSLELNEYDFTILVQYNNNTYDEILPLMYYNLNSFKVFPLSMKKGYIYNISLVYDLPDNVKRIAFIANNELYGRPVGDPYGIVY